LIPRPRASATPSRRSAPPTRRFARSRRKIWSTIDLRNESGGDLTNDDQRERPYLTKQQEVVPVSRIQRRSDSASAEREEAVINKRRQFCFQVRPPVQQLRQDIAGFFPFAMAGRDDTARSFERGQQRLHVTLAGGRARPRQELLRDNRAEVDGRRLLFV